MSTDTNTPQSAEKVDPKKQPPIKMRHKSRDQITVDEIMGMYELFCIYYKNTPIDVFMKDLSNKTGAHIARRVHDGKIVGFSTTVAFNTRVRGKEVRCLFNGDTVMSKEYWGHPAFPNSFFRWLLSERLKHPLMEMHWFLVSMGYRTYLILANNFYKYYPNIDGDDPHLKEVAFAASEALFPGRLNRENSILEFDENACQLEDFVTPITDEERKVAKISFFERRNPKWADGYEMPCIGSLDWGSFIKLIVFDAQRTLFKKGKRKAMKQDSTNQTGSTIAHSGAKS